MTAHSGGIQMYSFDTSVFMDWQARYYPLDLFRSLEGRIEALIDAGECAAVALVHEEITAVGTPDLQSWPRPIPRCSSRWSPICKPRERPSRQPIPI